MGTVGVFGGVVMLFLFYVVGCRARQAALLGGPTSTSGCTTRATSSASPDAVKSANLMVRNLLIRGMLVGLVAGLAAFGFARWKGEPNVNKAIACDLRQYDVHHETPRPTRSAGRSRLGRPRHRCGAPRWHAGWGLSSSSAWPTGASGCAPHEGLPRCSGSRLPRRLRGAAAEVPHEPSLRGSTGHDRTSDCPLSRDVAAVGDCHRVGRDGPAQDPPPLRRVELDVAGRAGTSWR